MPPPTATASVRSQYHWRKRASTTPKIALSPAMAPGECRLVSAKKNAVSAPSVCPCSQSASLLSRATSALRPVTFHAMARKISPATRNALQPASASARGDRLGGGGFRSSGGGRASPAPRRGCFFLLPFFPSRPAFFPSLFPFRSAPFASPFSDLVTFHAMARKISPATRNALQPASASARGDRLGGCGLRSSGGARASTAPGEDCYFVSPFFASRSAFFASFFALRSALFASLFALRASRSAFLSAL